MYPRLGGIENLAGLQLYTPMLVIAVVVANILIFWLLAKQGFRPTSLFAFEVAISVFGFVGAKSYSVLFQGRIGTLEQELEGGWRYPGALLGMLAAALLVRRLLPRGLSPLTYLDAWAPAIAIAFAIGRIGCLMHGCCYGAITSLPWAIRYPFGSIPWYAHRAAGILLPGDETSAAVHPFPIYLFLMEAALGGYLLWLRPRARFEGCVVLQFLAIHGIAKGGLEILRDPFSWAHLVVVPIGFMAVIVLWQVGRRSELSDRATAAVG